MEPRAFRRGPVMHHPEQPAGLRRQVVERAAEVWLNGVRLGEHRGGFSRFRLDATAALKPGQPNLLVVRTDNALPVAGSATAGTFPLRGDFFVHGGLYRPVSLVATGRVHFDMLDHGGTGVYATTTAIRGRDATVEIRSRIRNDGDGSVGLWIVPRMTDADGKVATGTPQTVAIARGAQVEIVQSVTLRDARLWQGVSDPHLYSLGVEIRSAKGQVLDRVDQSYGVRQIRIDPQRGLFLNGQHLALHGVSYHQDREGKGWAQSNADVAEDVALMLDMGVNTIRLTHYQHGETVHDLADRHGLILWDEIPVVGAVAQAGDDAPTAALTANADQQLRELIQQNCNHASVAAWGLANKVDYGNFYARVPARGALRPAPDPLPLLRRLNDLAHRQDASRPTPLATCCEERLFTEVVQVPTTADRRSGRRQPLLRPVPRELRSARRAPRRAPGQASRPAFGGVRIRRGGRDDGPHRRCARRTGEHPWQGAARGTSELPSRTDLGDPRIETLSLGDMAVDCLRLRDDDPRGGRFDRPQHQGADHIRSEDQEGRVFLLPGELDRPPYRARQQLALRRPRVPVRAGQRIQQRRTPSCD